MIYKKLCFALVAVLLLFSLPGCSLIISKITTDVADTNGPDDHSLAHFDDAYICSDDADCYCATYGFRPEGEASYTDKEYWHDADQTYAHAMSPLSGVTLLQLTYGRESIIRFTVTPTRTEGNLRIVLLDENQTIIHDFSIEESSTYEVTDVKDHEYEILAVGESALFEITVTREFVTHVP
ncbi:MAG: hypothetical protein IJW40_00740 [Clostridia bacterium]|nr:hypothetical protein [Clostridia bacterium]